MKELSTHHGISNFRKNILHFMNQATMRCTNRSSGIYPLNQSHMM